MFLVTFDHMQTGKQTLRFSGHETFVCRYAWLPKAVREVQKSKSLFKEDKGAGAMVALGVGKNMVQSIRFWAESSQVIEQTGPSAHRITPFGRQLLSEKGYDSYLEDSRTLWLLHWKIATNPKLPIFFWHQLLNFWHRTDFAESEIIPFFVKNAPRGANLRSENTLEQGYRVFVNTYAATGRGEIVEDTLDSPLVQLDLVRRTGERRLSKNEARETIYAFNFEDKPAVTPQLFAYCLDDFWTNNYPDEKTLPFRTITSGIGSPGQVLKLPEVAVRKNLDLLMEVTKRAYLFEESVTAQHVVRNAPISPEVLLDNVYLLE